MKFLLYSLFGGLLMLAAVIGLYVVSGGRRQARSTSRPADAPDASARAPQKWLFLGFFIAFAIKAPLWPFHTWLPDAARRGPARRRRAARRRARQGRHVRHAPLLPAAVPGRVAMYFAPLVITLAVIGIIYGALLAIGQTDHQAADRLHLGRRTSASSRWASSR